MSAIPADAVPVAAATPAPAFSAAYRNYVLGALAVVGFLCAVDKIVISMFMEAIKKDFSLTDTTINKLNATNATTGAFASMIYSGYLYNNYKAHTGWLRLTYLW